jgi:ketosteroid isomerase-like protein
VISRAWAEQFARDWVDSWNAHNLDRVLSHYAEDFEMSSPFIVAFSGEASGTLKGKAHVGAYWWTAFNPDGKAYKALAHYDS